MSATAAAQSGAAPINPCMHSVWSSVQLETTSSAAGRDGLVFSTKVATSPQGLPAGGTPSAASISVEAIDAAGAITGGSIALDASYGVARFAWRPTTPLAANARLAVRVTLANLVLGSCPKPPDVVQSFDITTVADLTSDPVEPPLRAIAYGEAWTTGARFCCEALDIAPCGSVKPCAQCWSSVREPTIVPLWDAALQDADPLEYALFYGAIDTDDSSSALLVWAAFVFIRRQRRRRV